MSQVQVDGAPKQMRGTSCDGCSGGIRPPSSIAAPTMAEMIILYSTEYLKHTYSIGVNSTPEFKVPFAVFPQS